MHYRLIAGLLLLATLPAGAAGDDSLHALTDALKPVLAKSLPPVLYEKSTDWGHQEPAPNGLRWHGLHARPRTGTAAPRSGLR